MDVRPLIVWLLSDGREVEDLGQLLRVVSHQLRGLGVHVDRTFFASFVLHPQTAALSARWRAEGDEVAHEEVAQRFFDEGQHEGSPLSEIHRTRRPLRVELRMLSAHPWPDLQQLLDEGFTDYAAFPIFLRGVPQGGLTFATRHPLGFGLGGFEALEALLPTLTAVLDRVLRDFVMQRLLMAYLGEDAGTRVFHGEVRRGEGQTLRACIWFSDLRGFTALSDRVEAAALLDTLNATFDVLVGAIEGEGGQVLKFIGDGLLAVFFHDDEQRACRRALDAARAAQEGLARLREARRAAGAHEPEVGVGLHFGDVTYGNIGGRARLDFTVIGRAVNLAARLEALCSKLGRPVLVSDEVTRRVGAADLAALGEHLVKGVALPVRVYGLT